MAPIQGHLMVPKAMRIVRSALAQAKSLIRTKAPTAGQTYTAVNPVRAYTQKTIAVHPTALLKQSKPCHSQPHGSQPYSIAQYSKSKPTGPKYNRSSFSTSRTSRTIAQNGTVPFASTLRPNLTGGTLPRSAGGYSLGGAGGTRQFSHTSGCQAQVVQNVSAGIRAFLVNGSKARFDGIDPVTGEKKWRAVTKTQNTQWTAAPSSPRGTSLDFQLSPTVTALLPTNVFTESTSCAPADEETTLNSTGILRTLSSDFARALRDLALITHDLSKLAAFGDLPISLINNSSGPTLRVRFPGCDADAVLALCDEVDIRRGVIVEDVSWTESRDADMALLFPFAPAEYPYSEELADNGRKYFEPGPPLMEQESEGHCGKVPRSRSGMLSCDASSSPPDDGKGSESTLHCDLLTPLPSSSPEEGYESLSEIVDYDASSSMLFSSSSSALHSSALLPHQQQRASDGSGDAAAAADVGKNSAGSAAAAAEYEGVEGIYRFLQAIDDARPRR